MSIVDKIGPSILPGIFYLLPRSSQYFSYPRNLILDTDSLRIYHLSYTLSLTRPDQNGFCLRSKDRQDFSFKCSLIAIQN
jgi:hypothetical protein